MVLIFVTGNKLDISSSSSLGRGKWREKRGGYIRQVGILCFVASRGLDYLP